MLTNLWEGVGGEEEERVHGEEAYTMAYTCVPRNALTHLSERLTANWTSEP